MTPPKISVYITSYNQRDYLKEAVESVLAQTLRPFEIFIIDDGSADDSKELIKSYEQSWPGLIKPIFNERNRGQVYSRNLVISQFKGDYFSYLDGDDRFLPKKLEVEYEALAKKPGTGFAYSNSYWIDEHGKRTGVWILDPSLAPQGEMFLSVFAEEVPRNVFFIPELINRRCLNEVDLYDARFTICHDWDFKIRLAKKFCGVYCHEILNEHRFHSNAITSNLNIVYKEKKGVYKKNLHLLEGVPARERKIAERKITKRIADWARSMARKALALSKREQAIFFWIDSLRYGRCRAFDKDLLAAVLLPSQVYKNIKLLWAFSKNRLFCKS